MLSDTRVKTAKPAEKIYKLYDENGLYLEVPPTGKKRWRFRFSWQGKERRISLGVYPDISLKQARDRCQEARAQVADGVAPGGTRKSVAPAEHALKDVAEAWITAKKASWRDTHLETINQRLSAYIYPSLGQRGISTLTPQDFLAAIRVIEKRGALEAAARTLNICSQVCRYAVACGIMESDPCRDLRGALTVGKRGHFAAITDAKRAGMLMRSIQEYGGSAQVRLALLLAAYTFVRPGNIRGAEWEEIRWDSEEWLIAADKMKGHREHIVPLSRQALQVLKELLEIRLSQNEAFIFPAVHRTKDKRMSEGTLNAALRIMGFGNDEMTAHGFRAMASTLLNEQGWRPDVIERQLAHVEKNKVRGAYNRAEYITERRQMMQAWADYLDQLAEESTVRS